MLPPNWEESLGLLEALARQGVSVSADESGRLRVSPRRGLLPGQLGVLGRLWAEVRALLPHPEEGLVRAWLEPLPPLEERSFGCDTGEIKADGRKSVRTLFVPLKRGSAW